MHGLDDPSHTAETVDRDFLCFCSQHGASSCLMAGTGRSSWGQLLQCSRSLSKNLMRRTSENVFSPMTGSGRSLRFTAEVGVLAIFQNRKRIRKERKGCFVVVPRFAHTAAEVCEDFVHCTLARVSLYTHRALNGAGTACSCISDSLAV